MDQQKRARLEMVVSMAMFGMDTTRTFKYNTLVGAIAGVIAGIAGIIFIMIGVM